MALAIRITPRADKDLDSIRRYLVQRSPKAADRVRHQIFAVLQRLADLPQSGLQTSEPSIRVAQLVRYPYRIFYIIRDDAIEVVSVRHTSRQPITPSDT